MAILDDVLITVSSDGKEVGEYQPPADDREALNARKLFPNSPTVVKYIEATPGAQFQIEYRVTGRKAFGDSEADSLTLRTFIDGGYVPSPVRLKAEPEFDGTMADMQKKYGHVGTIRVEVTRMRRVPERVTRSHLPRFDNEVPEKVLKGQSVDTRACLGQPKPSEAKQLHHGVLVDKEPCAVLIFLYRSKSSYPKSTGITPPLGALSVIPRSPTPIPLEERDPDTLTREEAVELAEAEAAKTVRIKKEKSEEDLRKFSAIKREATDESDDEVVMIAPPERKKACKDQTVIELSD
ncbi:hypothetical protein ABEF95_002531 [Exophiala dermatitidis]